MMHEKVKWPAVSVIVCTLNCKDNAKMCFSAIKNQDYPKNKLELIAIENYSTDGTIEVLKELGIKIYFTHDKPENGGKRLGYLKSKGDIVIFIDSDNEMMERDWIKKMVKPLIIDKTIGYCISRMAVVKTDILANQSLSLTAPDPFVEWKSMDAQIALNKLPLEDCGDYETYTQNIDNFLITGGNYFASRKDTLDKIGGYGQDVEVAYKLANIGVGKIGIPKNAHLHHYITKGIKIFFIKKIFWGKVFFKEQRTGRSFNWIPEGIERKFILGLRIIKNLVFIPNAIIGLWRAIKFREKAWLLHPLMVWLTTFAYVYSYISIKINKLSKYES